MNAIARLRSILPIFSSLICAALIVSALTICPVIFPSQVSASKAVTHKPSDNSVSDDGIASSARQPAVQRVNPAQIKSDADELAKLAATVPTDVARANRGILAKDLKDRLKRIEKLSKKLRGELVLD